MGRRRRSRARAEEPPTYDIVELPVLPGGETSTAQAINDSGETFGSIGPFFDENQVPQPHPVFWPSPESAPVDLTDSILEHLGYISDLRITALNNAGIALGTIIQHNFTNYQIPTDSTPAPFSSTKGGAITVRPPVPSFGGNMGPYGDPIALSDDGHVLMRSTSYLYYHGNSQTFSGFCIVPLDATLDQVSSQALRVVMSAAIRMNNHLQVIGYTPLYSEFDVPKPILLDARSSEVTELPNGMDPKDINDSGIVAGTSVDQKPILWRSTGEVTRLPLLDGDVSGTPQRLNSLGWAIGDSGGRPALWREGKVFNLASLIVTDQEWALNRVYGINVHGAIVGVGMHQGKMRGFVLTPL